MRAGMRILVCVATILALATSGIAQPTDSPERPDVGGATTTIPVSPRDGTEVMEAESSGTSSIAAPISLEQPIDPDLYICGAGDVFELNFWGKQNFRLRIAADLEGRTFISKVGFVAVAGKTLTTVRTQITKKVRNNYPGLQFDLTLVSPRTFLVHIVDNVKSPGAHVAHPTERLSAVIERAGGITKGSRRRIAIHHRDGTQTTADLVRYELTGDTTQNPILLDGDIVRVPFADLVVTVAGAIRRPGSYELIKTRDLAELIELADGLSSAAARSLPIRVVRRDTQQRAVAHELAFVGGVVPNEILRDDDQVFIRGAEDLQRSVLLIGAVAGADTVDAPPTSRRLAYVEGDTVLSIVDRAGGVRAQGDLSRSYISRPSKSEGRELIAIDLDALLVRREFAADRPILMGDTIVVPPLRHSVMVEGAVTRSGLYTYNPRFGIPEYIAQAGGRTRVARDLDEVKLVESSGVTRPYRKGLTLSPGDTILVPERNFTRSEVVQIVIAATGLVLSGVAITIAATR